VWVLLALRATVLPLIQLRRMRSGQPLISVRLVGRLEMIVSLLVLLSLLLG